MFLFLKILQLKQRIKARVPTVTVLLWNVLPERRLSIVERNMDEITLRNG